MPPSHLAATGLTAAADDVIVPIQSSAVPTVPTDAGYGAAFSVAGQNPVLQ
jgi:hypothetical protein